MIFGAHAFFLQLAAGVVELEGERHVAGEVFFLIFEYEVEIDFISRAPDAAFGIEIAFQAPLGFYAGSVEATE